MFFVMIIEFCATHWASHLKRAAIGIGDRDDYHARYCRGRQAPA